MERKSFPFELEEKGLDPEARTFKGYAAITGLMDDGGDIIDRGAFKKTLAERGKRVKVFYIHDFKEPIGKPLALEEVPRSRLPKAMQDKWPQATGGLYVHAYISETAKGNDALTLMRDNVLDELSIGYKAMKEKMEDDGPEGQRARHLKELSLMDISPVPLAMQEAAIVTEVKEMEEDEEFEQLEAWDEEKPYPNEHACRLKDPGQYDTCRRGTRQSGGKTYSIIFCKKTGGKMEEQAYRYPKGTWSASEARAHCSKHGGRFEAAAKDIAEEGIIKALIQEAEFQRQQIEEI
ncbi:MAG: HK97 family phage prohead protease [Promethearchaeota archaeon]